mmetsp:Transcript_57730/g.137398  ORF Transcript_57730/g.137398 Transcript_57730/m.137398 type:complete len:582 (+) Transcript_57730:100-1845(+)
MSSQPDAAAGGHEAKASDAAAGTAAPQSEPKDAQAPPQGSFLRPSEIMGPDIVYRLYRGITASIHGKLHHVWVDFTTVQLRWARCDVPAMPGDDASLLNLSQCRAFTLCDDAQRASEMTLEVYDGGIGAIAPLGNTAAAAGNSNSTQPSSILTAVGRPDQLWAYKDALNLLFKSRDEEGKAVLEFIQQRLFQYLWRRQGALRSEQELFDGQAVLAFNLDPKGGVAYLRSKLNKCSDSQVGEWLAGIAHNKGGIDPTLLGNYFSRLDAIEVTKTFISLFDFAGLDIVPALRRLFDTFKPGGESQVITRILEFFAETYFNQWKEKQGEVEPVVSYRNSDSVLQVAVSLIMLNTGLHVLPVKIRAGKRRSTGCMVPWQPPPRQPTIMTVEQYISNTRNVVDQDEVPEAALRSWYDTVRDDEISVEPMPRLAFSTLPVQPDIEGWLIMVLGPQTRRRAWAVLALQRLYFFSDRGSELEPSDVIDLRDMCACSVPRDSQARDRLKSELRGGLLSCRQPPPEDLSDLIERSFQIWYKRGRQPSTGGKSEGSANGLIELSHAGARERLTIAAEAPDLMEKWVSLISFN